jgi:prepilin-type N-terminal cleavage/methylation domain-containing protein
MSPSARPPRAARPGHAPAARAVRGFTLIEVAVAITLLSLTMTFVYQILSNTIRCRDATTEGLEGPKIDNAITDQLIKDFRFLYWRPGQLPADGGFWGRGTNLGDSDRVDFITARTSRVAQLEESNSTVGNAPLVEVGYAPRRNETAGKGRWIELWRRESYFVDDNPTEGGMYDLIYDKIRKFDLKYYNLPEERAKDDQGLDEWDSKLLHKIPYAVVLTLEYDVREANDDNAEPQGKVRRILLLTPARDVPVDTAMAPGMTTGM